MISVDSQAAKKSVFIARVRLRGAKVHPFEQLKGRFWQKIL